jgi:hypothetical protein
VDSVVVLDERRGKGWRVRREEATNPWNVPASTR